MSCWMWERIGSSTASDRQVLALALKYPDILVVSDDRRLLASATRFGLRFTTAPQLVVILVRLLVIPAKAGIHPLILTFSLGEKEQVPVRLRSGLGCAMGEIPCRG